MTRVGTYKKADADADIAAHAADPDAHTYNWAQKIRTGEYFLPYPASDDKTQVLIADRIVAVPFLVARALTIDRLAIQMIAEDAGKIARLGIYQDGTNLCPGALVKDYGTVSVAGPGVVAASADQSLNKGLYWLVVVSNGTPTIRHLVPAWDPLGVSSSNLSLLGQRTWQKNAVGTGALADPFVAGASTTSNRFPAILPRLKSLD